MDTVMRVYTYYYPGGMKREGKVPTLMLGFQQAQFVVPTCAIHTLRITIHGSMIWTLRCNEDASQVRVVKS